MRPYKFYLASGFFTEEQLKTVMSIEDLLTSKGIKYYSPRHDGVIKNMTREEKISKGPEIVKLNKMNIKYSDVVLAVIDGFDIGTIWEMGYASGLRDTGSIVHTVSFTNHGYGLNIMIQGTVDSHIQGLHQLDEFLGRINNTTEDLFNVFQSYRNFEPAVT